LRQPGLYAASKHDVAVLRGLIAMSDASRLKIVYKDLENEHRRLMTLMDRLRAHDSLLGLLPVLEQLRTLLIVHFAREQLPDGFYEALGERAQGRRDEIQVLISDHGAILATLNALLADVKDAASDAEASLLAQVTQLVDQLHDHEQREHSFAVAALGDH
jgi:hypothetical protein